MPILLMVISNYFISGYCCYSNNGYSCLFMPILLMAIHAYFINGYLFILLVAIGYFINGHSWLFY